MSGAPIFSVNDGVGDAFRAAAAIKRQYGTTGVHIRCESDLAAQAWRTLRWVESVEVVDKGHWFAQPLAYRASLACPEALAELGQVWQDTTTYLHGPRLWLEPSDFRVPVVIPKPTVVQLHTGTHKQRYFDLAAYPLPYPRTVVGYDCPTGGSEGVQDLRWEPLEVAIGAVVSPFCERVIGVESWACLLGALLGKPVVMEISLRAAKVLAPNWQRMFPTMTFRLTEQEP